MNKPVHDPARSQQAEFDFAPFAIHSNKSGRSIDLAKFVLSIWKPLALGLCLGIIGGVSLYVAMGPVYSASSQVLVSKKASVPLNDSEANRYGDRGDHVQLIQTDLIVERAYEQHGLKEIPALASAYDPLKNIKEGLSVKRSAGQESSFDNILDISFLHPDKKVAAAVVQAMIEAYRDYLADTRDENARELYETLLGRLEEMDQEIATDEAAYQQFRRESPVFLKASPIVSANGVLAPPQSRYEAELAAIEQAQNANARKRSSIQARLATLERKLLDGTSREALEYWVVHAMSTGTASSGTNGGGGSSGSGAALAGPPAKAQLDQQLLEKTLLEQRLLNRLGSDHVDVQNVRRQIDTILQFYSKQGLVPPRLDRNQGAPSSTPTASNDNDLVAMYRDLLQEELKELDLDDANLTALHKEAEGDAKKAEMFEIEDQHRKDKISNKKQQRKQVIDQIAAYDISKEQEGYRLQQISQVRIERSLKQLIKLVGACSMFGVALVFCLAYFREWQDTTLRTLDEVRTLTGTELAATVPQFTSTGDADRLAEARGLDPALCYFHRPGSREAESYRTVRTSLFVSLRPDDKVIQFSSPEPGDGKSTTASNLAIAMAQSSRKVLLVDCDLRRPTLHHLFRTTQSIGLTEALLGEIDWLTAIRETPIPGLSLMTSGDCPDNPAELLASSRFANFLKAAREDYDFVILDSPPVLAVSDPSIVSQFADGMVLVVRMRKTKRPTLRRVRETLMAHGVRILGAVANGFDTKLAEDAGYNYDAYGSYYAEETPPLPTKDDRRQTPIGTV